ncbi:MULTISPECIES: hypothetical protein [Streptomyces]|uniref:DUF317 domain-containing protein n=1 Tax=Streptomyces maoxianensis TaxID=1459942 RepID=A0ABV9GE53_9ACTN|nr:hypothetical protein [Streptomyces sp. ISL-1]MBT2391959.1 hypothetical protein [Streptomyces sp. ISL-1]
MTWASWTTTGIYAGAGGVLTEEVGVIGGDLTVHTTWSDGQAEIAVQFSGASDWYTMVGSPISCPSEEASRTLHQSIVEAVRGEDGAAGPGPVSVNEGMAPPA